MIPKIFEAGRMRGRLAGSSAFEFTPPANRGADYLGHNGPNASAASSDRWLRRLLPRLLVFFCWKPPPAHLRFFHPPPMLAATSVLLPRLLPLSLLVQCPKVQASLNPASSKSDGSSLALVLGTIGNSQSRHKNAIPQTQQAEAPINP